MIVKQLKIYCLRNLAHLELSLHPQFTFITGANGSGKTTILEALHLLSCGHSFRSRETTPLINYQADNLTVFAQSTCLQTISIQKSTNHNMQIKLNHNFCNSTSQLAYQLPCQIINADLFQIIDAGAAIRRKILDWGLFYYDPNYLDSFKKYKNILKQRNALLKTNANYDQFYPWDTQLSATAEQLDKQRLHYFTLWQAEFYSVLKALADLNCTIHYQKGWDKKTSEQPFATLLKNHFQLDRKRQFTQLGPHQADLLIEVGDHRAKHILSRGQQKIILIALKIAQANLLRSDCLILLDDLSAELDHSYLMRLYQYLSQTKHQYVITSCQDIRNSELIPNFEHFHLI